ncbi:MAG: glycosyltransferase [Candidatus Omnitrophica bacterium]|nr:glycosyltransferase [Candidatus Omnitrophota bacterium]
MTHNEEKYNISVVIPTFNGAERVPDVLNALQSQRGICDIRIEVLVVDNNSTDRTREMVLDHIGVYGASLDTHYLFEARPGAGRACIRGAERARGELLGFLDDDNVPAGDWVCNAVDFGRRHPRAAAWASKV